MPSAPTELQDKMEQRFGSIDTHGPEGFLKKAGYKLLPGWMWQPKPGVTDYDDMTPEEYECLVFLVQEWDYGGLKRSL